MWFRDKVWLKKPGTEAVLLEGVSLRDTVAVRLEQEGVQDAGEAVLRIPARIETEIACGDLVRRKDGSFWYTVVAVRDNRHCGSRLAHRKVLLAG